MTLRDLLPEAWRNRTRNQATSSRQIQSLHQRIDEVFDDFLGLSNSQESHLSSTQHHGSSFSPACDVDETDSHYLLDLDLPGVQRKDVKIEVRENHISVSGDRNEEARTQHGRASFHGSFRRSFALPQNMDADRVEANYENGVLHIAIPKKNVTPGRQVQVSDGSSHDARSTSASSHSRSSNAGSQLQSRSSDTSSQVRSTNLGSQSRSSNLGSQSSSSNLGSQSRSSSVGTDVRSQNLRSVNNVEDSRTNVRSQESSSNVKSNKNSR